jgi:hypothetical protein
MDTENIMLKPEYLKIVLYNPSNQKTGNAKVTDIITAVKGAPWIEIN